MVYDIHCIIFLIYLLVCLQFCKHSDGDFFVVKSFCIHSLSTKAGIAYVRGSIYH